MSTPDIVEVFLTPATSIVEVVATGPIGPPGAGSTDASTLSSGTLPDARLSSNVVLVAGLTAELLARVDLATGITASQRVAGAVPILNNAETAFVWSNFTP